MAYLFGDLTPAPFTTNVLEEIRDAIDFAAALADADQCVATADERREVLRQKADEETAKIETLVHALAAAAEGVDKGERDSATASFSAELAKLIAERRSAAEVALERKLDEDIRKLEAEMLEARADYFPMLERYLLVRVPPATNETLRVELVGVKKDERHYVVERTGASEVGLTWSIEVGIPAEGQWSETLRVDDVMVGVSITAPYLTGLIKKEVKPKKTKIGKHVITKVVDDGATVRVEMRDDVGKPEGFDVIADLARKVVMVTKTGEEDDETAGTFDVSAEDQPPLLELADKVRGAARALPKKKLSSATFDGLPFDGENTDAQPKLVQIVARISDKLAPTVEELAKRSRSEEELVLRRVLEDGRREEVFMPKTRLREKLEGLDNDHRDMFIGLESALDAGNAEQSTIEVEEAPVPAPQVRSEVPPAVTPYVRRDSNKQFAAVKVDAPKKPTPRPMPAPRMTPSAVRAPVLEIQPDSEVIEPEPPSARTSELKVMLKQARTLSKEGKHDEAYRAYASLFGSAAFTASRPEDQRAVLKMMIHAKTPASVNASADAKAAHKAALPALQALVVSARDPADYEMLGMAYAVLDEPAKATEIFKKALEIERTRSPGSDLCGDLMRRVSQL